MEKVSIIIPVYNAEKFLNKCIDSVVNQTYQNIEIILIDDGSTDNSSEICKEYQKKHPNIIYRKTKNSGVSYARNTGLELATGKYVFFIDSDDYLEKESIKLLTEQATTEKLVGLTPTGYNYNQNYSPYEFFEQIMNNKCMGNVWGYLFEKNKIDFIFDENTSLMEDTLFLINYLKNTNQIVFINEVKYNYVVNLNGITKSKNIDKIIKNVYSFDYSLDKIKNIFISKYKNKESQIKKLVEHKKIKLVESELIKITKKEDLKKFVNNEKIRNTLIENNSDNIILKMIKYLILNKKIILCIIYINIRRFVLVIKKFKH